MTTYAVITPESESDPNYAKFEYLLGWYDYNGAWQQKLFTDWLNVDSFDNDVYNKNSIDNVGSILKDKNRGVRLTVEDATIDDLKVYLSIFEAEKVYRIYKSGEIEEVAPNSNSVEYEQRGIRYQFSFNLVQNNEVTN